MRIKIETMGSLNYTPEIEIFSCAEQSVCARTENQRQDLTMDGAINKETEIVKYDRMIKTDDANDNNINDDMYLPITSKSTGKSTETLLTAEYKNVQHSETCVIMGNNEMHNEDKVDDAATKTVILETNKAASNRRSRRSSRLSANDKKENLKKICNSGKVVKQKTTRKSNRTTRNTKSDELLMTFYKKFETEGCYKPLLPSFAHVNHNNDYYMFDKNMPHYGVVNQEEVHQCGLNNNRNTLQYLDCNHLNHQVNFMNSIPWLIASRSDQNIALNNITNMQNNVGQSGFVNDRQYHTYPAVDYNWKQNENPYSYSSINSTDPYKLLPVENKGYCLCSICTNYMRNNMYPGIESLPRMNTTFQPMANNITSNYSSTATSNNLLNAAVDPFNSFYNYQPLQADYNYKKLFYETLNMVNYTNNCGCEVTSTVKDDVIPPLNNWHHINRLTCNSNNLNIPLNTAITSDELSSSSVHASNTNAHFSNHYNRGMVETNVSADQYSEKDNFHPYTIISTPTFENSLPAPDTHGLDSDKLTNTTTTLSQNTTTSTDSGIIADITNFLPETDTDVSEKSPSGTDAKKKDWLSDVFNTIYKDF